MAPSSITYCAWGLATSLSLANSAVNTLDIPAIPNLGRVALTDANIRDATSPDGWKRYAATAFFRNGFITLDADLLEKGRGDMVHIAQAETLSIIAMRNVVLRDVNISLPLPSESGDVTEQDSLKGLIAANTSTALHYYPAASHAYAYEPTVQPHETLAQRFRRHNWFLPTQMLAAMYNWHAVNGTFDRAVNNLILTRATQFHTTGESINTQKVWIIDLTRSGSNGWYDDSGAQGVVKSRPSNVLPMVQV